MQANETVRIVRQQTSGGFSVRGLLGLLAAIFLICIVLLPTIARNRRWSPRVACTTHLRQISMVMILWSEEHGTNFPMRVSWTNGGSKELTARGWVAPTFWAISKELQNPAVATCPGDKERLPPAKSFNSMTDGKISYFLHLGTMVDGPQTVLLGDRNVATNGVALPTGVTQIHDPQTVSWMTNIHQGGGNIALADGSVHQVTSKDFRRVLKTTIVTNTLVIP